MGSCCLSIQSERIATVNPFKDCEYLLVGKGNGRLAENRQGFPFPLLKDGNPGYAHSVAREGERRYSLSKREQAEYQ